MQNTFEQKKRLDSFCFKQTIRHQNKICIEGVVIYLKPNELGFNRLGISIAKKNIKKSSDRNKIKRVCRESFRLNQNNFCCYDIVIISKRHIANMNSKRLAKCLEDFWQSLTK